LVRVGDEAVTDAADGEEVDGLGGVGFEVAAEADDEVVDGAGVGIFFDVPDVFEEFFAGNDLAGMVEEIAEEVGLHEGEVDGFVVVADFEGVEIDGATGEGEGWLRRLVGEGGLPMHAAEESGEASEEDVEVEWFGKVVVRHRRQSLRRCLRSDRGR